MKKKGRNVNKAHIKENWLSRVGKSGIVAYLLYVEYIT
jgi:hypothetical protein